MEKLPFEGSEKICEKKDRNKPVHFEQMDADFNASQIGADKKSAKICEFLICANPREKDRNKPIHFTQMDADFNATQIGTDKKSAKICEFLICANPRENKVVKQLINACTETNSTIMRILKMERRKNSALQVIYQSDQ